MKRASRSIQTTAKKISPTESVRTSTMAISENGSVAKMLAITGLVGQLTIVLGGTAALHTHRVWGAALT